MEYLWPKTKTHDPRHTNTPLYKMCAMGGMLMRHAQHKMHMHGQGYNGNVLVGIGIPWKTLDAPKQDPRSLGWLCKFSRMGFIRWKRHGTTKEPYKTIGNTC